MPADQRYKDLDAQFSKTFKADFDLEMQTVKKSLGSFGYFVASFFIELYMNVKGDPVMYDEIAHISEKTGIAFSHLAIYNYFYEAGCTSIIGYASDGTNLLFASNLDFNHAKFIRKYSF